MLTIKLLTTKHLKGDRAKFITEATKHTSVDDAKKAADMVDWECINRTMVTYQFNGDQKDVDTGFSVIIKSQFKYPVKRLVPDESRTVHIVMKQRSKDSDSIKNANVLIQHLGTKFNNVISFIPINQNIPEGTIFNVDVTNPYDASSPKMLRSASIKPITKLSLTPFNQWVTIGVMDYGSLYKSQFIVKTEVSDGTEQVHESMQLFRVMRDGNNVSIITYDHVGVSAQQILKYFGFKV